MKAQRHNFQVGLILVLCALQYPVSAQAPFWEWARSVNGLSQLHCNQVQAIDGGCFTTAIYANSLILPNDTLSGSSYMIFTDPAGELRMGVAMSEPQHLFDIGNGRIGFASAIIGAFVVGGVVHTSAPGIGLITGILDTSGTAADVLVMPDLIRGFGNHRVLDVHQGTSGNLYVLGAFADSVAVMDTVLYDAGIYVARFTITGDLIRADRYDMYPIFEFGALVEGIDGIVYVAIQNDDYQPNGLVLGMVLLFLGPDGSIDIAYDDGVTSFHQQNQPRLAADPYGGVFLAYANFSGIVVLRFSSTAELIWENHVGGNASPSKIEATDDGGLLVSGSSISQISLPGLEYMGGGPNCIVYELSAESEILWAIANNNAGNVFGAQASKNSAGEVYAVGWRELRSQFGPHVLPMGPNPTSGYIARIGYGWLGINEHVSSPLRIHPNPAHDRVWISLPGSSASTVQLIDQQGRPVREEKMSGGQVEVDVRGISPGSYMVRSGSSVGQIIVE